MVLPRRMTLVSVVMPFKIFGLQRFYLIQAIGTKHYYILLWDAGFQEVSN